MPKKTVKKVARGNRSGETKATPKPVADGPRVAAKKTPAPSTPPLDPPMTQH